MKKWSLRIGVGLFAAILLLYLFLYSRSVAHVEVADAGLRLERADVPQRSNGFFVLLEATNQIWWPRKQRDAIDDLAQATNLNWNAAFAAQVLSSNAAALQAWDRAAELPAFQVPESKFADPIDYLSDWKKFARLASIRENALMHEGNEAQAFDEMMKQIQLGQKMESARGALIHYLVGAAVKQIGYAQLRSWAAKTQLSPAALKNYLQQLETQPAAEAAAYADAMRMEYQFSAGAMKDIREGKLGRDGGWPSPILMKLVPEFNLEKTKAKLALGFQFQVDIATNHYCDVKFPAHHFETNFFPLLLSGNAIGEILGEMLLPALETSFAGKVRRDASLQATRTILALRAYQRTHGSLPTELLALVPEFLNEMPLDPFDGKPLRYSAEKKIVYSVGKNLQDDGGDDRGQNAPETQRHLDLVFKFDF
jgi:hypothetical protein